MGDPALFALETEEETEMVMDWTARSLKESALILNPVIDDDDGDSDLDVASSFEDELDTAYFDDDLYGVIEDESEYLYGGDWMMLNDLKQAVRDLNDPDDDVPAVIHAARRRTSNRQLLSVLDDQTWSIAKLLLAFDTRLAMLWRERDNIDARIEIALKRDVRRHRHNRKLYYPDYGHRRGFHLDQHPRHDTVTY